jgi:hypothetical protein
MVLFMQRARRIQQPQDRYDLQCAPVATQQPLGPAVRRQLGKRLQALFGAPMGRPPQEFDDLIAVIAHRVEAVE